MPYTIIIDADWIREITQIRYESGDVDDKTNNYVQNLSDDKIGYAIESASDDNENFWNAIDVFHKEVVDCLRENQTEH